MAKVIIKKTPIDTWQVYLDSEDSLSINDHMEVLHTFKEARALCMKALRREGEENEENSYIRFLLYMLWK